MNKKLIAVALAALPAVTMADVTVYGTLSGGWEGDKVTNLSTQARVDDYTSFIGFKGNEDLGNGLKAIWQVESHFHVDGTDRRGPSDSPNTLGSRQTFVGAEGAFGKVRLGRLNNALQDLNDIGSVDPWVYGMDGMSYVREGAVGVDSIATSRAANGLIAFSNAGARLRNALRYDTPDLYGFNAHIEYGFGEDAASNRTSSDTVSLGLGYTNSGFFGRYAFQQEMNPLGASLDAAGNPVLVPQNDNNRKNANINRVEIGYDANNLLVALGYQRAKGYDWADVFSGDAGFNSVGLQAAQMPVAFQKSILNSPYDKYFLANKPIGTSAQRELVSRQAALTVGYTIGAFTPRISYAKGWDQNDNVIGDISNSGYQQYVLGVDYKLSKRTKTGISYGNLKWDQNATQSFQSVGATSTSFQSTTVQTWGISLTHDF